MARARQAKTELDAALGESRRAVMRLGGFSAVINLLILAMPLYMLQVYDRVLVSGQLETLLLLTLIAVFLLAVMGVLDAARSALAARAADWISRRLGPIFLEKSVRARLANETAGIQAIRDVESLRSFLAGSGLNAFLDAPWTPIFLFLIWMLHPMLGIFALAASAILLGLSWLNEKMTRAAIEETAREQITAQREAEAVIRNADAVAAMGMIPGLVRRWRRSQEKALGANLRAALRTGQVSAATKFARQAVQVGVLGLGAFLVLEGAITSGAMIASSILLGRALAPIEQALGAWRGFSAARLAFGRLREQAQRYPALAPRLALPEPEGRLSVSELTVRDPQSGMLILKRLGFELAAGKALAIIGPSASGKSTLCRHIVGLQKPTAGEIRIDGARLDLWDREQIGAATGFLPQDVELFPGSVRDNIARMGAAPDHDVLRAAKLACAHEVILGLPNGYDTLIGEGGVRLSGGQRQRIGLARALFGDPKLVVLDEPNANLDQAGEAALAAAIASIKDAGAALIIVGHRPSTLAQADLVMVLKDGQVAALGPRDEILRRLRRDAPGAAPGEAPVPTGAADREDANNIPQSAQSPAEMRQLEPGARA